MTRSGRKTRLAIVALTAAALTGCSVHPGVAATVGQDTITVDRVTDVAQALCSANSAGAQNPDAPAVASRGALQGALQVLLDTELSHQFGERENAWVDQRQVSAALAGNAQSMASLPEDEQEAFRAALKGYAEGQLMLIDLGRKSLTAQGKTDVSNDQALAEGTRLRDEYTKTVDIEVNPRYGAIADGGTLQAKSGSLSVPASQRAVEGAKEGPSDGWVSGLPTSQQCG